MSERTKLRWWIIWKMLTDGFTYSGRHRVIWSSTPYGRKMTIVLDKMLTEEQLKNV